LLANAATQAGDLATLTSNAASQAGDIATIYANLGAVSGSIATLTSNAAIQAGLLDTLTGNAASQGGELATLVANAATQAGALATLTSNAASQSGTLADLIANAAVQAGLIAGSTGTYGNANVAAYLPTYDGNIAANISKAGYTWTFGTDAVLTLPSGGTILESGYGSAGAIRLKPNGGTSTQYLEIAPTAVDGNHVHLMAGSGTELFLGDDNHYVKLANTGGVVINSNDGAGNTAQWTFGTTGNLTIPGSIIGTSHINIDNRDSGNTADINLYSADDILLQARDREGDSGSEGGDINIYAGDSAVGSDATGGDVQIRGGDGGAGDSYDNGGDGGYVTIQSGQGGAASGIYSARSGGDLTLRAGDAGTNNGNINLGNEGGTVIIEAGDSTANGVNGGTIYLTSGAADASALAGDVVIQAGGTWTFGGNGNLNLPQGGTITEGGGLTGAIRLTPSGGANDNQALLIYPTAAADGDHIHLTAAGGSTELYLGNDLHYVKLVDGGNVELRASTANLSAQAAWTFDTTGKIDTIQALGIKVPNGVPSDVAVINSTTGSWEINPRSDLATTGGSGSGLRVNVTETGGYASTIAIATAGTGYNNGDLITVTSGTSNATFTIVIGGRNTWTFGTGGTTQFPNSLILAPVSQSITMQSDQYSQLMWQNANVTVAPNMATYSNFYVAQNSATLDIGYLDGNSSPQFKEWLWSVDGNLTLPSGGYILNSDNSIYGAGSSYSNVDVASYLPTYTGNIGNIDLVANLGATSGSLATLTANAASQAGNIATLTANAGAQAGSLATITSVLTSSNVAIGENAAYTAQGQYAVAIGLYAGGDTQGERAVAIGSNAGKTAQGAYAVAIGRRAGETNQGNNSIIINATTGVLNQTTANTFTVAPVRNDVANISQIMFYNTTSKEVTYGNIINIAGNVSANYFVGNGALLTGIVASGSNYSNANVASYLPTYSGNVANLTVTNTLTLTATKIALGSGAGAFGGQGTDSIAIGRSTGQNIQGNSAVAVGGYAGQNNQGDDATAIGQNAGFNTQSLQAVAVGSGAGQTFQSMGGVAVGYASGQTSQGLRAVAIGSVAGNDHQGQQAIAIGHQAGYSYQPANSIEINASGTPIDYTDLTAGLYITSVKNDTANVTNVMYYNTTSKEVTYGAASGSYSNSNVASYLPTYSGNITAGNVIATRFIGNTIGTTATFTSNITTSGTTSYFVGNAGPAIAGSTASSVGYMGLPQSETSTSATLAIGDAGKHIYVTTNSQTITIPAASSVAYPIGTTLTFIAGPSATTVTIAITSDTMYLAGTGTTGSRTLAAHGMATAVKVSGLSSAGVWYINGSGLT
jgi:hypothetical protein